MAGLTIKRFSAPDERRPFGDKGHADYFDLGGRRVMRTFFQPGWRWSQHGKPLAGTDSCQSFHAGYVLSGRMRFRMDDGEEAEAGPGDVLACGPGHDAWVVGDEPCVLVDFGAFAAHAQPAHGLPAEPQPELAPPSIH